MGKTSKSAWTGFERAIAAGLSTVFGSKTTRNPLSGANSRQDNGEPRPGDVIIPQGYDMLVEAKYRAKHAHHTLYDDAVEDAKKHGINPKNVLLYTKVKGDRGVLVTLDMETFHAILVAPQPLTLFRRTEMSAEPAV